MEWLGPASLFVVAAGVLVFIVGLGLSLTRWGRSVPSKLELADAKAGDPWHKKLVDALAKVLTDLVKILTGKIADVPRYALFTSGGLVLIILGGAIGIVALAVSAGGGGGGSKTPTPGTSPSST